MGYIDDNFEYSAESNNTAKEHKFMIMDYEFNVTKIDNITTMHQLEAMTGIHDACCVGKPVLRHERGFGFCRAVFTWADNEDAIISQLRAFTQEVASDIEKENLEREKLALFFEVFENKVKWTHNVDPSKVGLTVWLPQYSCVTDSYTEDIKFYKEVLHTVFIREDGAILIPSFMVLSTAMRTQCRGWHLCCNRNLTGAIKKYKEVDLTEKNALWWIKKTTEECL